MARAYFGSHEVTADMGGIGLRAAGGVVKKTAKRAAGGGFSGSTNTPLLSEMSAGLPAVRNLS